MPQYLYLYNVLFFRIKKKRFDKYLICIIYLTQIKVLKIYFGYNLAHGLGLARIFEIYAKKRLTFVTFPLRLTSKIFVFFSFFWGFSA